jgi:hypothetical protein
MRLRKARVRKYRSIRDTGLFDIEPGKTILVGPNEAGKSALLAALQRINPPGSVRTFDALRDYPRSEFNDIVSGKIRLEETTIVEGHFDLEAADKEAIPAEFRECRYIYGRRVDNSAWHMLDGGPSPKKFAELKKELVHLLAHVDSRAPRGLDGLPPATIPSTAFAEATRDWEDAVEIKGERAATLKKGLEKVLLLIEEGNETEEKRYDELMDAVTLEERRLGAVRTLHQRLPVFVRFRDYFKVRPLIHLEHLAQRLETNVLDGDYYDYGNQCLLRLLGFSARELSNLGKANQPKPGDIDGWRHYQRMETGRQARGSRKAAHRGRRPISKSGGGRRSRCGDRTRSTLGRFPVAGFVFRGLLCRIGGQTQKCDPATRRAGPEPART